MAPALPESTGVVPEVDDEGESESARHDDTIIAITMRVDDVQQENQACISRFESTCKSREMLSAARQAGKMTRKRRKERQRGRGRETLWTLNVTKVTRSSRFPLRPNRQQPLIPLWTTDSTSSRRVSEAAP